MDPLRIGREAQQSRNRVGQDHGNGQTSAKGFPRNAGRGDPTRARSHGGSPGVAVRGCARKVTDFTNYGKAVPGERTQHGNQRQGRDQGRGGVAKVGNARGQAQDAHA